MIPSEWGENIVFYNFMYDNTQNRNLIVERESANLFNFWSWSLQNEADQEYLDLAKVASYRRRLDVNITKLYHAAFYDNLNYGVMIGNDNIIYLLEYDPNEKDPELASFNNTPERSNAIEVLQGGPFGTDSTDLQFDVDGIFGEITLLYSNTELNQANIFKRFKVTLEKGLIRDYPSTFKVTDIVPSSWTYHL